MEKLSKIETVEVLVECTFTLKHVTIMNVPKKYWDNKLPDEMWSEETDIYIKDKFEDTVLYNVYLKSGTIQIDKITTMESMEKIIKDD